MNKKIALMLPIIITTPFLMANSPAPGPTTMGYDRFKASVVLLENREDSFYYELQINNVGDKYIPISTLSYGFYSLDDIGDINDKLFIRECIPPGINKTYHFITSKKLTVDKETRISAATFAYEDDSIVFEDAKLEKVEDKERTYKMSAEISGEWDYYDDIAIVEIEYQGNTYAFEWSKRTEYIEIEGEELNLDDVVIKKITTYGTRSSMAWEKIGDFFVKLGAFIGIFFLTLIVVGVVVVGIVVPVTIINRKRRNNENKSE